MTMLIRMLQAFLLLFSDRLEDPYEQKSEESL